MTAQQDETTEREDTETFARFERAKRTHAECIAKELTIRDELQQIERRKVELSTMRKLNGGQRDAWLQDLIETTIIPYSKSWNRKFAGNIQKTLPLELRSMVYSYLMDDDTWDDYENHFMAVTSVLPPEIGHCSCMTMSHGMPRVPHFLFPEYMGGDAAREVVEKVYLSNWFKDKTLYGIVAELGSLIHRDPFGAGFDPASRIQSLDIVCVVDQYRQPPVPHLQNDCRHTPYERRYIDQDRLKSEFHPLLGVVHSKDFQGLKVTFTQRNVRIDVLEEALEAFVDVYQAFKAAAVTIRVQWMYSSATCGSKLGHTHSRNLGKFFTQPRYTWKYRMLQFLEQVKPCIKSRHVRFINEPSLGLSDTDFVHRMWDDDETFDPTDDEDSEDDAEGTDFGSYSQSGYDSDAI